LFSLARFCTPEYEKEKKIYKKKLTSFMQALLPLFLLQDSEVKTKQNKPHQSWVGIHWLAGTGPLGFPEYDIIQK